MAIRGVGEDAFQRIMGEYFTPSATIKTPERLYGRTKALQRIERAVNSQGRQILIYGDRGVGKTSVALTAAILHSEGNTLPIYVVCSETGTFSSVIKSIGDATIDVKQRYETPGQPLQLNGTILGTGGGFSVPGKGSAFIPEPQSLNEALDVLRYVLAKRGGRVMVVVDEMERMSSLAEREKFAELIKNLPELGDRLRFIFCGIGTTVNELIGSHPSAGRVLETIELERLHHNYLWEIVSAVASRTGVAVEREVLIRIGQISDGFPHYVHLIGASLFWSVFDDPDYVSAVAAEHFRAGITGALTQAEPDLRLRYERATMKTKNKSDYEETLWALADRTSDKRQLSEIFDGSYRRIMLDRSDRQALPREKLNARLLSLKTEAHGRIVVGYGSGWFGFRENIVRGYVRLRAENEGVKLGLDHAMTTYRSEAVATPPNQ